MPARHSNEELHKAVDPVEEIIKRGEEAWPSPTEQDLKIHKLERRVEFLVMLLVWCLAIIFLLVYKGA